MDFRRIEWIFLVVFVGLNIFLGISFFQAQQVDLATTKSGDAATITDITRDQIKLPHLSKQTPEGEHSIKCCAQQVGEATGQHQ